MTDMLATILSEVRSLHAKVDALRPSTDDQLVAAIAATKGVEEFTACELLAASVDQPLQRHLSCTSVRSVGRLLSSLEGRDLGGVIVSRLGECREGVLWQCKFVE